MSDSQEPSMENGIGLTFDQEQTADQLLADIQSAVDEMLQDFQQGCITDDKTSRTVNEQVGCIDMLYVVLNLDLP